MPRRSLSLLAIALAGLASAQDLPKQARDRHEYDLIDVDWSVKIDMPSAAIEGRVVNTVAASKDNPWLIFDCANLTVAKVTIDGKEVAFKADGKVLAVATEGVAKGQKLRVEITYSGKPEAGIYFVPASRAFPAKTDIVYTQGEMEDNRYWLPTYDSPNDKATSQGTIEVPAGWRVLSNGENRGVDANGSRSVWHWRMDKPHSTYLISLLAGPYTDVPDGTDPVPVSIWTPVGLEEWGKNAFGGTDAIIRFYGKQTGQKFPWPKYAQSAVSDFMFGGMENVTATTQTITALFPDEAKGTRDSTGLDAHELAHQWFGDFVTTPSWNDIWINEGWATFMPHFWARQKYGQEEYDIERFDTIESAKGAMWGNPNRSMVWDGWKVPMDAFDGYAYPGGAARMFALMHMVGEKPFWRATRAYLKTYGLKNVDTAQFFQSYSKSLGRDLSTFETEWFRTPSTPPTFEVRRQNGQVQLHQTQAKPFHLTLDVWSLQPNGAWVKKAVTVTEANAIIDGMGTGPVLVDAEAFLPIQVKYSDATKDELVQLWKHAPNAAAKLRLVGPVMEKLSPAERQDLATTGSSNRLLVRLMGYVTDEGRLRGYAKSSDENVRRAAYEQMSRIPATDGIKADLHAAWEDKKLNPDLRLAALESLYTLTKDQSLLEAAWHENRFDDGYRVWALNTWAGLDPNRARALALDALDGSAEPLRLTAIRVLGRVKDAPGERKVFDRLASMMDERSNSPLRAAIGALGDYGDPAAIPLLEKRANHGLHFVRGDVANALARLGRRE